MGRGRKVESVLSELPEPTESQAIVRVTGTPGGNLVQVADEASRTFLARVPSKFRNVIWIRIGACALAADPSREASLAASRVSLAA